MGGVQILWSREKIDRSDEEQSQLAVRVGGELEDWFRTTRGVRQGDPISPISFMTYLERMLEGMKEENEEGVKIQGRRINNLRFADDIDLIEKNRERLQESLTQLCLWDVMAPWWSRLLSTGGSWVRHPL